MEIGIDIGTSYSSVAVLGKNGVLPVKSDTGQCAYGNSYSIPSAVFAKKDGTLLIGQAAVASRMIAPSCFRDCFKRDFGSDTAFLLGDNEYTTDQLYIEFFKHFRQQSEKLTGLQVTKAYITHPANYTEYKKQKLRTAAAYAGLLDIQLIDEPTAAALSYYEKGTVKSGERLLVYDFGGGTFDLALLRATEDGFELMTSPLGLEHCGGVDFDMMIYEDIVNTLSMEHDLSAALENIKFRAMLSEESIKTKHKLSFDDTATAAIPYGYGEFIVYNIDRDKYNRMIARQVMQTCDLINKITENAGIKVSEIDRILCVGGTTRTPYILEMLEKTVGKKVFQNADPELAICCGAAAFSTGRVHEVQIKNDDLAAKRHEMVIVLYKILAKGSAEYSTSRVQDVHFMKDESDAELLITKRHEMVNILHKILEKKRILLPQIPEPKQEARNDWIAKEHCIISLSLKAASRGVLTIFKDRIELEFDKKIPSYFIQVKFIEINKIEFRTDELPTTLRMSIAVAIFPIMRSDLFDGYKNRIQINTTNNNTCYLMFRNKTIASEIYDIINNSI
jgi:hypothetical protein